jgi:hypothetical protein
MAISEVQKKSFSLEEMVLVYTLLGQADAGQELLFDAYEELNEEDVDEILSDATHTLSERGMVSLLEDGSVELNSELEKMLSPLGAYKNMIQVLTNRGDENSFAVTDYYLGKDGSYSAIEIDEEENYQVSCGQTQDLAVVIQTNMGMLEAVEAEVEAAIVKTKPRLRLADYANLEERKTSKGMLEALRSYGFDLLVRQALVQDVLSPIVRGSVSVINISSETPRTEATQATGEGLLWLRGKRSSWILTFPRGDEKAVAAVLPGTAAQAGQVLTGIISRVG